MSNIIEPVLYIGSAAVLYQGITKQKVLSNENVKYGTAGALFGMIVGPKLEEMIRNDESISPEIKQSIQNTLAGAVLGGGAGYVLSQGLGTYLKEQVGGLFKG